LDSYTNFYYIIMATEKNTLNLARKWRSQTFEQIVGQDLSIKMLKNSLARNRMFPVYLFSGQRGCGKTSTARIFAAAVNCAQLANFQRDATSCTVPCLACPSCTAMMGGNHPDFIEIDAASHTGVDNVRQIIDAANYMPLVGQKKIYLIDEAHMLSKAAFNACLKILEEPPTSALFILATTEVPKIPATIVSRCFQLIFGPLKAHQLKDHLRMLCTSEQISIEDTALDIIIDETEGSARDAINLLERVRFSNATITAQTVRDVLGKISMGELSILFTLIITQNASKLLEHLMLINFEQRSPQLLWDMIIQWCRAVLWTKYGVTALPGSMTQHIEELKACARSCSLNRLTAILTLLWAQEELFLRTTKKHLFLEMTLLQLCQQVDVIDLENLIKMCQKAPPPYTSPTSPLPTTVRDTISPQAPLPHTGGPGMLAIPTAEASAQAETPATVDRPASMPIPVIPLVRHSPNDGGSASPSDVYRATTDQSRVVASAKTDLSRHSSVGATTDQSRGWGAFLQEVTKLNDPLLCSICAQATFVTFNDETHTVTIQLSADSAFFKNKIEETKALWLPLLSRCFESCNGFTYVPKPRDIPSAVAPTELWRDRPTPNVVYKQQAQAPNEPVSAHNAAKWPKASLILRHFPGKIRKTKVGVL
jgi:DNA polymerase-3 subunit gamma/tau